MRSYLRIRVSGVGMQVSKLKVETLVKVPTHSYSRVILVEAETSLGCGNADKDLVVQVQIVRPSGARVPGSGCFHGDQVTRSLGQVPIG